MQELAGIQFKSVEGDMINHGKNAEKQAQTQKTLYKNSGYVIDD